MVQLYDKDVDVALGTISEEQLRFLQDRLEKESGSDQDYYINQETLERFARDGADPALLALLRGALGTREDMEIRWVRL